MNTIDLYGLLRNDKLERKGERMNLTAKIIRRTARLVGIFLALTVLYPVMVVYGAWTMSGEDD